MKYTLVLSCIILLAGCQPNDKIGWTTYNKPGENFTVTLPDDYSEGEGRYPTPFGEKRIHFLSWRNPNPLIQDMGVKLLECSCYELSPMPGKAEQVLDACNAYWVDYYHMLSKGRIVQTESVLLGEVRGRKISACVDVHKEDSLLIFITTYVAGKKVYTLHANGYKSVVDSAFIDHFRNSFRFKP